MWIPEGEYDQQSRQAKPVRHTQTAPAPARRPNMSSRNNHPKPDDRPNHWYTVRDVLNGSRSVSDRCVGGSMMEFFAQLGSGGPSRFRSKHSMILKTVADATPRPLLRRYLPCCRQTVSPSHHRASGPRSLLPTGSRRPPRSLRRPASGSGLAQLCRPSWTEAWIAPAAPEPLEMSLQGIISRPALVLTFRSD